MGYLVAACLGARCALRRPDCRLTSKTPLVPADERPNL